MKLSEEIEDNPREKKDIYLHTLDDGNEIAEMMEMSNVNL